MDRYRRKGTFKAHQVTDELILKDLHEKGFNIHSITMEMTRAGTTIRVSWGVGVGHVLRHGDWIVESEAGGFVKTAEEFAKLFEPEQTPLNTAVDQLGRLGQKLQEAERLRDHFREGRDSANWELEKLEKRLRQANGDCHRLQNWPESADAYGAYPSGIQYRCACGKVHRLDPLRVTHFNT